MCAYTRTKKTKGSIANISKKIKTDKPMSRAGSSPGLWNCMFSVAQLRLLHSSMLCEPLSHSQWALKHSLHAPLTSSMHPAFHGRTTDSGVKSLFQIAFWGPVYPLNNGDGAGTPVTDSRVQLEGIPYLGPSTHLVNVNALPISDFHVYFSL